MGKSLMSCFFDSQCTYEEIQYKKLSYRRGNVRRAVLVKIVLSVAQMFVELHLISPALGK